MADDESMRDETPKDPDGAGNSAPARGGEAGAAPVMGAAEIEELLDDLEADAFADVDGGEGSHVPETAVFDDEFIRARRALNAARGDAGRAPFADAVVEDFHAPEDGLSEEILNSRPVWNGAFLRAEDLTVRLPNGRIAQRDVVRHPGAVAVIALTSDGKIVLVHQYRTPLEQVTLEIPAGKLDPGEDPEDAAARELREETGYVAGRMAYLCPVAMAPGYSDEVIHLYMAMGLTFVGARPDDDEFVHVDLVDLDEMVDAVLDGKVIDAKTVVGILLCDAISRRMEP